MIASLSSLEYHKYIFAKITAKRDTKQQNTRVHTKTLMFRHLDSTISSRCTLDGVDQG